MEAEAEIHEEAKEMGSQTPKQTGKARVTRPPHNYVAIVKASVVPIQTFPLDKLCDQLYDGVFLQQEGKRLRKYWVDRHLNKNCFMVLARELAITWGDTRQYWQWKIVKESGNVDVEEAELRNVCWLEITGKFRTVVLSPNTLYEVSLVASMAESSWGWSVPVKLHITLPDESKVGRMESLQQTPRGKPVNILMGEFMTSSKNIGELTFSISETSSNWKNGLVVKGVAFQPKN
ncbi:protein PHLOEM PROTEIN 2-LIKE A1-like [Syzygium oleosum]|uniref:protein PHLOEM PROTEIN 2-LIKE A1-like n=1 Tax=Syzygium oleosum TaxID=219896 RepID=UPI0024BBAC45|nr:protein PHLOEM PROTEIN 2-LIKE A1-like [Syzygium oleosum]